MSKMQRIALTLFILFFGFNFVGGVLAVFMMGLAAPDAANKPLLFTALIIFFLIIMIALFSPIIGWLGLIWSDKDSPRRHHFNRMLIPGYFVIALIVAFTIWGFAYRIINSETIEAENQQFENMRQDLKELQNLEKEKSKEEQP